MGTSSIIALLSGFYFNLFSVGLVTRPCANLLRLIFRLRSYICKILQYALIKSYNRDSRFILLRSY